MMRIEQSKWERRAGRWVLAAMTTFALSACTGTPGEPGTPGAPGAKGDTGNAGEPGVKGDPGTPAPTPRSLAFAPVKAASTDGEKRAVTASTRASVNGQEVSIGYQTELRSGQKLGEHIFGRLMRKDGQPVKSADGSDFISPSNDFSSLLRSGNRLFEVTHFETTPAAMYLSELSQSPDGKLTAMSTRPIDFSKVDGLWYPCAGSVSPWNTHLGGEEYPPNARATENASTVSALSADERPMLRYFGLDSSTATMEQVRAVYNPYRYGFLVEVAVDGSGTATVTKHYAAGRRALELSYVMPDRKTVYLSDDGTNDAFYMFIAARAGDLSEGQLYAARWFQTSGTSLGAGQADLVWLPLGPSATDAQVKAIIDGGITFSRIFDVATPSSDNKCPADFRSVNTEAGFECLKLKDGQELAASRLESRRYAAYVGATTEFRKTEGMTYNAAGHKLYVSFSELNNGMLHAHATRDLGGPNHIRLAQNDCGAVYELAVWPNADLGSDYVAGAASALIEGTWLKAPGNLLYSDGSPYYDATFTAPDITSPVANVCDVSNIANPDNLSFIPGYDTLIIGEDAIQGHQNDVVWAFNVVTRKLTRILSTPYGSETTGVYFYPDLNGHAYLKAQVQHPYGESDIEKLAGDPDPTASRSYTGYIGPFPAMN